MKLRGMVILCLVFNVGIKVLGKPAPMEVNAVHEAEDAATRSMEGSTCRAHSAGK